MSAKIQRRSSPSTLAPFSSPANAASMAKTLREQEIFPQASRAFASLGQAKISQARRDSREVQASRVLKQRGSLQTLPVDVCARV